MIPLLKQTFVQKWISPNISWCNLYQEAIFKSCDIEEPM
uniref:Uncharacterized protein n=1 Tax=Anguilla anguilla TaxID=7936 RepID=A0A0E9VFR5_ANGAN